MPYGFHTGHQRSYVPRFNTTVNYDTIAESDAPEGCFDEQEDADWIKYQYEYNPEDDGRRYYNWNIKTCISSNALKVPIKNTRDRQDFDEEFYLNITQPWSDGPGTFRVSARTTIGYYELPNYHNNGSVGPLLEKYTLEDEYHMTSLSSSPSDRDATPTTLDQAPLKGPLTLLFAALFGLSSFPAAWSDPDYLAWFNSTSLASDDYDAVCERWPPLARLMSASSATVNDCLMPGYHADPQRDMAGWLYLWTEADDVAAALETAAAMANEIRLLHTASYGNLYVPTDAGVEVLAPVVALPGLLVGSVLLGAFLGLLGGLVLFAVVTPHWADRLDAGAVLKMGAAMALSTEGLAKLGGGQGVLDRAPGFVGDAMVESDVGRLAVGAEGAVRKGRRYESSVCGMMQG
ncbi:uncharacterized protein LTHEOB_1627 [Neofusicoccum parvum]|nr:uncharacterized protein LTHEOB_1627 [Neofusicoccum parvum]